MEQISSTLVRVTAFLELHTQVEVDPQTPSILELPVQLDGVLHTLPLAVQPNDAVIIQVDQFCAKHVLNPIYCTELKQYAHNRLGSIREPNCQALECCLGHDHEHVCVPINRIQMHRTDWSSRFDAWAFPHQFLIPEQVPQRLTAWLGSAEEVFPLTTSVLQIPCIPILFPRNHSTIPAQGTFDIGVKPDEVLCIALNDDPAVCGSNLSNLPYNLNRGQTYRLKVSFASGTTCESMVEFQVEASPTLVIVTAVSVKYFVERRLHNFVASIQYWEPERWIHVVSLDLPGFAREEIQTWKNVRLTQFDLDHHYPPHVHRFAETYAFKPLIMAEMLQLYEKILWMDANMELRRPLAELEERFHQQGYFFIV